MTGTIRATANDILNQVGVEIGLSPVSDPFASSDQSFRQLSFLINTAGEELSLLYEWDFLRKLHQFTTPGGDDLGDYDLPADYLYMINQTARDLTNDCGLEGPLTAQDWAYLTSQAIAGMNYLAYRLTEDKMSLFPHPPPAGTTVQFEYISRNWVLDSTTGNTYIDKVQRGADTPLFNRTLMGRMLKVKFLESKGFDTSKAQADLNQAFILLTSRNKGAPILSTKPGSRSFPFVGQSNVPDTGYGG